jgi:cysteine sulfinate desulfinase/cysteine desulfurase-like protein
MQVDDAVLRGSLRFSLGATTTEDEIDEAVERISEAVRCAPATPSPS